jgi:quercetin dioxygenase-like cupin family protein
MVSGWRDRNGQALRHYTLDEPGESARRHVLLSLAIAWVLTFGLLGPGRLMGGAAAQDATPPAGAPLAIGVTIELIDTGEPMAAPGKVLNFVRVTFEPGGYLSAHGHPGAQIWYIDEGMVNTTVLKGTIRLTRPPTNGTPVPPEEISAGMEGAVVTGESMYFDSNVIHTIENVSDEPAVILISAILEADQPPVIFAEHGGH